VTQYDTIIVGQGLAGTALAWTLLWRGQQVLVIDRDEPATSSRIAAGLITPITGQRLVKSWRFDELWPFAIEFYRRVEQHTGRAIFHRRSMVRLLSSDAEQEFFQRRSETEEFRELTRPPQPSLDPAHFVSDRGHFEMQVAGQLDVANYLTVSRETFHREGTVATMDLNPEVDIQLSASEVIVPRLNARASRIAFCEGAALVANPWFREVVLKPAKGEILTVRIPGLAEQRVVHRGVWLCPLGDELFRVGATYEWQQLDNIPTALGRDEITAKLNEFLRLPVEVIDHQAAVRPIHRNQYPVYGLHPAHRQLGYLNGLGSKGTLHAPYFADQLANMFTSRPSIGAE
jgi:glycine oxidase